MNNKKRFHIGVDIGGTNIEFALIDASNSIFSPIFFHAAYPKGADLTGLCLIIYNCIQKLLSDNNIDFNDVNFIGIAMPGGLDTKNGIVCEAYNLNLFNAPIVKELEALMPNINIKLINDADAATIGEFKCGALCGKNSGCLITLGTGVGAGIIINGRIYSGGMGRGTELGHMTLKQDGEPCSCGNRGCVETLCSATYIIKEGKRRYNDNITRSAKDIFNAAKEYDEIAMGIFDDYINNLSSALSSYIALLDPEIIALGGGVSMAGDQLLLPLIKRTEEKSFFRPIPKIVIAKLGDKAGAIGASFII